VASRSSRDTDADDDTCVSLSKLMELLRASGTMEDAVAIEETLKDIFKAHPDKKSHRRLEEGVTDIIRGKHETALKTFESLVEQDAGYAEAWNKVAACQYMLGQHSSALEVSKKAVDLQPMNFQAFSGAGLCEYEQGNHEKAAALFRHSLALNPWGPVATKLSACLDMIHQGQQNKKGDDNNNVPQR
jgi:tetratricopeptide (TPR) repeat protein